MEERRKENVQVISDRRKQINIDEKALQKLIDTMIVAIVIVSEDKIEYVNNTFYKLTGYEKEDLVNIKIFDLLTDENKVVLSERITKRLYGMEDLLPASYSNLELKKKDGSTFTTHLFPSLICYDNKLCTIYIGLETTAYIKTEKALNGFFEHCPLPAFIKDRYGRLVRASSIYAETTGKSDLEIIGKKTDELFPTELASKLNEEDNFVFNNKKSIIVDEIINDRYYTKIKFPINGDLIGGFSMDITEKIEYKKELEESNIKYQELYNMLAAMLDNMSSMLWIYDKRKNIKFANKALKEYSNKINIFEIDECMVLPDKKETFVKTFTIEDEKEVKLEITKTPLFDTNGIVIGCNGYLKDVTELMKRQKKIVEKLEKLDGKTKQETKDALNTLNNTITLFNERWVN